MKIKLLYDEIIHNYNQKDYELTLNLLNEYFSIKKVGITPKLLKVYADTLNKLYKPDEALKILDILKEKFHEFDSEFTYKHECAKVYLYNSKLEEAEEFLKLCIGKNNNARVYYDLGKALLLQGKYEEARTYFNICVNLNNADFFTKSSKRYIEKIQQKLTNGVFLEINYNHFKNTGAKLLPRHIVYAKEIQNINADQDYDKYKKYKIPYLIWKIDNNKIYAFPVSINIKGGSYHKLYAYKYPNSDFDRSIKDRLVCIDEGQIDRVIDYIHYYDFINILSDIYISRYITYKRDGSQNGDFFLEKMMENYNIQIHDILVYYDINRRNVNYYFVLDDDKEFYKTIELNTYNEADFSIEDLNFKYINKKDYVFKTLKLSDEVKTKIISMIREISSKKNKRY